MKRIIEECRANSNAPVDIVKLRLRGQGSGFKEGHMKRECPEPLHLCISSQFYDKFMIACREIEILLNKIYKEYANFCRKNQRKVIQYKLKKVMNVPAQAIKASLTQEKSKFDEELY